MSVFKLSDGSDFLLADGSRFLVGGDVATIWFPVGIAIIVRTNSRRKQSTPSVHVRGSDCYQLGRLERNSTPCRSYSTFSEAIADIDRRDPALFAGPNHREI